MIFEVALNDSVFLNDWKKGNIVPVHKKDLKIIFEKIIYTSMCEYFIGNEIFTVLSV